MTDDATKSAALSALLDEMWDPLNLYAGPASEHPAPGRYASFVPTLVTLLDRGATRAEVAWQLRDLAHQQLGLPPSGNESEIADLLLRWHALWTA